MADTTGSRSRPVLVTGATGFLGSHVCDALLRDGRTVHALARRPEAASSLRQAGAEVVVGDVTDPDRIRAAAAGCGAIVHCAAMVGSWCDRDLIRTVNVDGMRHTLEAALAAGVERFVEVSSVGVYGMMHHDGTDETAPRRRSGDPYTDSKIQAEELAFDYHRQHDLPLVVLRPGVIFGPRDRHFLPRLVEVLIDGRYCYVNGGRNHQTLVYVDNVVAATLAALREPAAVGHAFTITEPVRRTTREFVEKVASHLAIEAPTKSAPAAVAWVWCHLSELCHRLLRRREVPLVNLTSMRFNALSRHFDVRKAQELLGYAPETDLERQLEVTIAWLRDHHLENTGSTR